MILDPVRPKDHVALADKDALPPKKLPNGEALKLKLAAELEKLTALQAALYADRRFSLLVVLQGRDASGKDGVIRTVFGACNPQGCQITGFKVPTEVERAHDFLWRVHQVVPGKGMIGIFNRSHYEDVLVARVRNIVPKSVWSARYKQINQFESMLSQNGVVILKFFLHISKDNQRVQLLERLTDPTKNWKFRAGDLEDRALWGEYTKAYRDALRKCSTELAPWYVVPADHKTARNYLITRRINRALEKLELRYPPAPQEVLALEAQLKK